MPAGVGYGANTFQATFGASAIASSLYGGANWGTGQATGVNPLTGITPFPWEGALLASFIGNPFRAAGNIISGIRGGHMKPPAVKPTWANTDFGFGRAFDGWMGGRSGPGYHGRSTYHGPLGWKTLLLGVDSGGIWAKMSIGNVGLSAVELAANAFGGITGIDSPLVNKLANARKLGIAGMANIGDGKNIGMRGHGMNNTWLYEIAGVDPENIGVTSARKAGIRGGGFKKAPMVTRSAARKGIELVGQSVGARAFQVASGTFSLYAWYATFRDISSFAGTIAAEGVGSAARALFDYTAELRKHEFGHGRLPGAMSSSAAATERQRAIRASYNNKINPSGRMYGNEAMYHHSR
tara:strand:- start:161 stop:1216 length:1056 start_codon:yes stop_codon:yes gene_type:complete